MICSLRRNTGLPVSSLVIVITTTAMCNGAHAASVAAALAETKPLADIRLRYERVDQDPAPGAATPSTTANATILSSRLGFETGKAANTSLLAEGEFVMPLEKDYRFDNAVPGRTQYPIVADPEAYELNRFQLTNTSIVNTTIILGRQRINLDDQRFVGNVGWRMNEQTYDALRVVNKQIKGRLVVDFTYADKVNRIYGPESPQGVYKGDLEFTNLSYQFDLGKLTGFDYLLNFKPLPNAQFPGLAAAASNPLNPARSSTHTWGARFAGSRDITTIKLNYAASYAKQERYGSNPAPTNYNNDYYLGELTGTFHQYTLGGGIERLSGDGTRGFATPLATLHKFQGWVDKFLTTPDKGMKDTYATGSFITKRIGPFDNITLTAMYHDYFSTRGDVSYGHEWNVVASVKWQRFVGLLKYGDYGIAKPVQAVTGNAATTLTNTKKFWTQIEYLW